MLGKNINADGASIMHHNSVQPITEIVKQFRVVSKDYHNTVN